MVYTTHKQHGSLPPTTHSLDYSPDSASFGCCCRRELSPPPRSLFRWVGGIKTHLLLYSSSFVMPASKTHHRKKERKKRYARQPSPGGHTTLRAEAPAIGLSRLASLWRRSSHLNQWRPSFFTISRQFFRYFPSFFFSSTFFLIFLLIQFETTMTIIGTLMSQILFNKVTPFFKVKIQNTIGERRNPRKSSVQSQKKHVRSSWLCT